MRKVTRQIKLTSNCSIGSKHPILVQSMTNTLTSDVEATLKQIEAAANAGAELMRVSVPDKASVSALPEILRHSPVPIAADIHFDYKLALGSLEAGVHKLRINPGNIGHNNRVQAIAELAVELGTPIRVGVNAGSLEKDILLKYGSPTAAALVESGLKNLAQMEKLGCDNLVLSLKCSDVMKTVEAYRIVSDQTDYPLHLGITEAGTRMTGAVRSAVGLGILLAEGIGDTIRVSLSADPVEEIRVAYRILEATGIRRKGPTIISCPTCSRTLINVIDLAQKVEQALSEREEPLVVAVMGCIVNGPGEAREADLGVAGSGDNIAMLFKRGKALKKIPGSEVIPRLLELFDEVAAEKKTEKPQ